MKNKGSNRKGFSVPDGYFDQIENKIISDLKQDSKKGLKVPEGYFDDFEVKPLSGSPLNQNPGGSKVIKLNRSEVKKILWMAAAASVFLFYGIQYMSTDEPGLQWDDLEQAELSTWIESDLAELNAYEIAEAYPDVELSASTLTNDELDAYLNEIELDQILYEN